MEREELFKSKKCTEKRQKFKIILKKFWAILWVFRGRGNGRRLRKTEFANELAFFYTPICFWKKGFLSELKKFGALTTSWSTFGLHWCRLNFDLTGGSWGRRWAYPIFDLGCHRHKGRFHVRRVFGWCLQKWNAQCISVFL